MGYSFNESGKLVDVNGNNVFQNDIFNQLMSRPNLYEIAQSTKYIDLQAEKALFVYPDDARKFIDINCSKLIDDNASLASEENVCWTYIYNVISFLGVVNKVSRDASEEVKNVILGSTFSTKDDNSLDSYVPLYLCVEMLKAKCGNYLGTQISPLEDFDLAVSNSSNASTLEQEFNKVINSLKTLDYDKTYFSGDMDNVSSDYLLKCQRDSSGNVDIFAKCEEDKCDLYVTQNLNGQLLSYNIPMFTVQKQNTVVPKQDIFEGLVNSNVTQSTEVNSVQNEEVPNNNVVTSENTNPVNDVSDISPIPSIDVPQNNDVQINYTNQSQMSNLSENTNVVNSKEQYASKREEARSKYQELVRLRDEFMKAQEDYDKVQEELANIVFSTNTDEVPENENNQSFGMAA